MIGFFEIIMFTLKLDTLNIYMKSSLLKKEKNAVLILAAGYKAYDNSFISLEPFLKIKFMLLLIIFQNNSSA